MTSDRLHGEARALEPDGPAGFAAPTGDEMLRQRLVCAQTSYERASARIEKAREKRNRVVREALDHGWTHARISEATGLSRGRVGQIAQRG
jgi:DNA-directed RNA polymerase specialized sigma24 family protein